jgi:amino acid adenylation domain-containing protein
MFKEMFAEKNRCAGVVFSSSLDATPFEQTTTERLSQDLGHATVSATYLVQAIIQHGFRDVPRLFLITRGAQSVFSSDPVSVSQAPMLGLGKTIAMEHPELLCTRIDLPAVAEEDDLDWLLREFGSTDREDQVALRAQSRYVARLVPGRFDPIESAQDREPAKGRAYRLEVRKPGVLHHLALYEIEPLRPGPNEVLIQVKAAGLNFLDVLAALGALPSDVTGADERGPNLGSECAGTIIAVGEGVNDLVPGQEVVAMASRAIGSQVIARRTFVAQKPHHLSWPEAATLLIAFLTAHYALDHVGRLCAGERVLIHAGAGGVGLAAIQLAKRMGAEVFATAGSEEKRAYLRSIGVSHVFDSRSLRFVDEIKRVTDGNGVDVVLNSLAGDFIPASLSILGDYGRFVEIGKRDYFENKRLGLRPFLRNLSFSLVDLRGLGVQRPERVGAMLREVMAMFEDKSVWPLPVHVFPCSQAIDAFQFMAQAKHIGKIAIAMNDVDAQIVPAPKQKSIAIRADRTYLVTGGLGGLGLSLSQWLVDQGARHLMLVGRRGPNNDAAIAIQSMEQAGARVQCVQADVSRESEVQKLFSQIHETFPSVGGIVHAAMVLDDHTLLEQSDDSFRKVYAPKVLGAWHLHKYSAASDLDFFIMYSSAAGLMGSPGQANYCAANAYLDALCRERVRRGLPGMSIQWGVFSEVGGAAAEINRGQRLSQRGAASFSPAEGLEALRRLLKHPRSEVGIVRFDVRQWVQFYSNTTRVPFFAEVLKLDARRGKSEARANEILVRLQLASPEERLSLLENHLTEQVGAILRIESTRMDRNAPFQSFGLDSLTALELRNRIEATLGVRPSATVVFAHPSIVALAAHMFDRIPLVDPTPDMPVEPIETNEQPMPTRDWPLSPEQERLFFIERLYPGTALYNVFVEIGIDGPIDPAILRQSLAIVAQKHDALRMTFPIVDGQAVARVVARIDPEIQFVDLSASAKHTQQTSLAEMVRSHSHSCWDLERGPLWRATIATIEPEKHVLLLSMHHIIIDGWSFGILLGGVRQVYGDLQQGQKPQLPSLPLTYGRYALEQRTERRQAEREESILWWKRQLDGLPRLDLPFAKIVSSPTHAGDAVNFIVPKDLVEAIKRMATAESTTLFTALLAAWTTLLHRYTGQMDFPIGTVSTGRDRSELRDIIGFFVNTLVLRCAIQPRDTFVGLMQQLQRVVIDALQHENAPFDEVVRAIKPSAHNDLNPLIQTCFVLENLPFPEFHDSRTRWQASIRKADASAEGIAKFNLGLFLAPTAEGLLGTLEFATDIVDRPAIERLVGHFQVLLRAIVQQPHSSIGNLPLLTENETSRLARWNDTAAEYPADKCIHELFEVQAAKTPHAIAVVSDDKYLTYGELDTRSNQLARHLRALGVGPEVLVAICVERSIEMVVGLLGILKAGGAYVPIDPLYPQDRIAYLLEDTGAPVLVTQTWFVEGLPEHKVRVVCLDDSIGEATTEKPILGSNAKNLAYVIYTSGSTGLPKGVLLEHKGLVNLVSWHCRTYQMGPNERVAQVASLGFDAATWEIWPPLVAGARLVVCSDEVRSSPMDLAKWLVNQEITRTFLPTQLAEAVLSDPVLNHGKLGTILTGGDRLQRRPPHDAHFRLVNHYGPTECTVVATAGDVSPDGVGAPSIGGPVSNVRVHVLDGSRNQVPVGVHGELFIGGVSVARGYLNRPELTAERFVEDPFSDEPDARLYRTGDVVRWRDDGHLEFIGRVDHQVKIRGFRIELGEIEAVLGKHPAVRDCVVLVQEDIPGDKRLVAYVSPHDQNVPINDFREHIRGKLPDYMVPSAFVILESLPLSPSGKVDRKALATFAAPPQNSSTRRPPRSWTEMVLVDLWEKVLQVSSVGIEDDFFLLGGHSLLAVSLMTRIEEALGKRLPIATLMRAPTPETLARAIELHGEAPPWSPIVPFHTTGAGKPFFLVHPLLGTVMMYVSIARHLRQDRPCYGIQAPGLLEGSESFRDLEAHAAYYIQEIRKVQPEGPYLIGGYSYGGHIAVEIAKQLVEQQQEVKCLALLDTGSPDNLRNVDGRSVQGLLLEILIGMDVEVDGVYLESLDAEAQSRYLRQRFIETNLLPPEISIERILGQLAAHQHALANWKCHVKSPITFFRTLEASHLKSGDGSELNDNAQGWKAASSFAVDVHDVSGNHFTMVREPHVRVVAERLAQCLRAADPLPNAQET